MRKPNILLLLLLSLLCTVVTAQEANDTKSTLSLTEFISQKEKFNVAKTADKYYLQLQFNHIPTGEMLSALEAQQVHLLSYQSNNTYLVSVPANFLPSQLIKLGIETVAIPATSDKLSTALKNGFAPEWAVSSASTVDLAIKFHNGTSENYIHKILQAFSVEEIQPRRNRGTLIVGRIHQSNIESLASQPIVSSLDYVQEADQALNFECRAVQGVKGVQSTIPGGINLRGNGVVIGIGDGGELGEHVDLSNRFINKANGTYSSFGAHGDHVTGIVMGAGAINPRHRGIAPEAQTIIQKTSLITYYAEDYYNEHGMVITNNSYGTTSNCAINGMYNYSSQSLDLQTNNLPELLHVYAAGNNGWETCENYPKSFHTVLRYYQAAKNVLTVGNVKDNRVINPNSSRGPVLDGRLKPEICGIGTNVMSTDRANGYWNATGTSMSSPAVAATVALMVERYRELNGGQNPESALMKAIACNTADDLGNPGPDYTYGFGLINAENAINTIDSDAFESDHIENGESNTHTLSIPSGVEKVKVMLYWNDKEADAATAVEALVNDLDLEVNTPGATNYLPWILNPNPTNVNDDAVRGADHLNNIEQVTIDNPVQGNYELKVKGFNIPFGPQKYYLTYEFIYPKVKVTYPMGGESLQPNQNVKIRWDADQTNTSTFKAEWSGDNGNTWTLIKNNIAAHLRLVTWKTPQEVTEEALVRITKTDGGLSDISDATFTILGTPSNLTAEPICTGFVDLQWSPVAGAEHYQVMLLTEDGMIPIGNVSDTAFVVKSGLTIGETYWFSVRSISASGNYSERAVATSCLSEIVGSCDWNNDANLRSAMHELRGREKTSTALGTEESIIVEIENIGANDINEVTLYYQVDNETPVSEVFTAHIPQGEKIEYTFQQKADLSAPKDYVINAWIEISGDTHSANDFIIEPIHATQLAHQKTQLPLLEDFESLGFNDEYVSSYIGPSKLYRWDLDLGAGSLVYSEKANEGYAMTIGNTGSEESSYENQAILNLELSLFENTGEELYFVFSYKTNDDVFTLAESPTEEENAVFVRGSESDSWIKLASLDFSEEWTGFNNVNLTRVLQIEGQTFSESTQIMFQQKGSKALTIDNIGISTASRLPVTLDTFSAEKIGENVKLKWITLSEEGNDFFVIEMAEGVDEVMRGEFSIIGEVDGNGFSNQMIEYDFVDYSADKIGDRYYRLRQVDFGGKSTVSEFRVVSFNHVEKEVAFFPNPFSKEVTLSLKSEIQQMTTIRIYDGKGQIITEFQQQFQKGRQELPLAIETDLPPGLYTVHIAFADKTNQSYRISKIQD